jgi:type IV secretory pathway ATPase VirB11/archaellum biosynthesis ATPase
MSWKKSSEMTNEELLQAARQREPSYLLVDELASRLEAALSKKHCEGCNTPRVCRGIWKEEP